MEENRYFYHIRINQVSTGKTFVKNDLTEKQALEDFVEPYCCSDSVFINGKRITITDIKEFKVGRTLEESAQLIPEIRSSFETAAREFNFFNANPEENYVVEKGEDVTEILVNDVTKKKKLNGMDLIKHQMELATAQAREDSRRKNAEGTRKMINEIISRPYEPPKKLNNYGKKNGKKHPLLEWGSWIAGILGSFLTLFLAIKGCGGGGTSITSNGNTQILGNLQNNSGPVNQPIQADKVQINNYQIPPKPTQKEKKEIKDSLDKLANFYDMGDRVKGECTDPNKEYPYKVYHDLHDSWITSTRDYLKNNAWCGNDMAVDFDKRDINPEKRPQVPSTAPEDRSRDYLDIERRMENIHFFEEELRSNLTGN